jgi:hypothetical protein
MVPGDFDGDCDADYDDMAILSEDWLLYDYTIYPASPNTPVLWYKFDEQAPNTVAHDSAPGSYDIDILTSDFWEVVDGENCFNHAAAGNLFVPTPNEALADVNEAITICMWTYGGAAMPIGGNGDLAISGRVVGCNYWVMCHIPKQAPYDGEIVWSTCLSGSWNNGDYIWTDKQPEETWKGQWNHWAFTKDITTGEMIIYCNSVPIDSINNQTAPADIPLRGDTLTELSIGGGQDGTYRGWMKDLRIYDYALSQEEIAHTMGIGTIYVPLESSANGYDEEPVNSKVVNFKDYCLMAEIWMQEILWP